MGRAALTLAVVVVFLAAAPEAFAKSYDVSSAVETFRVEQDGSIEATEQLTFAFDGTFHGAYRLIPVESGEQIDDVQVSDGGFPDSPTGSALVGSSGAPGTFGVMTTSQGWTQVAWHFDATDTNRTFVVSYRMHGYIRAYRDVANLYLQVWGDQWPVPVTKLHVEVLLPGAATKQEIQAGDLRIWGHPSTVSGAVGIADGKGFTVDAQNVPARQFVEIDAVFPSRLVPAVGSPQPRTVCRSSLHGRSRSSARRTDRERLRGRTAAAQACTASSGNSSGSCSSRSFCSRGSSASAGEAAAGG